MMTEMQKTPEYILSRKNSSQKIVCLTSYTAPMASISDKYCDLLLVGDSIGMALYGMDNTTSVTLEIMIAHGRAVAKTARNACVIVDMPFGTYETSAEQALENAQKIIKETGAHGVKLEGGEDMAHTISTLTRHGIPVMAHIGLLPQSVEKEGGYKIKGKTEVEISRLLQDAKAIEKAGAFAVVIEGTIESVAHYITKNINIPTIGIGASPCCDGQILVCDDMLGTLSGHTPKFVKKYADLAQTIDEAVSRYSEDVKSGVFPSLEYTYQGKKV